MAYFFFIAVAVLLSLSCRPRPAAVVAVAVAVDVVSYQLHCFEVFSLTTVDSQWAAPTVTPPPVSRWANAEHTLHRAIAVVASEGSC